ncbi:FlgD immunoglobulin-like domain containing protein [Bacteroidota bacterium]
MEYRSFDPRKNYFSNSFTILFCFLLLIFPYKISGQTIVFDDSDPQTIKLGNSYYEIGILKSNNAFSYIYDKTLQETFEIDSENSNLWMVSQLEPSAPIFDCGMDSRTFSYPSLGQDTYNYIWSENDKTLSLEYIPDPNASNSFSVTVKVTISEDPFFDMELTLFNNWGYSVVYLEFPNFLTINLTGDDEALVPYCYPGALLGNEFFSQSQRYEYIYPKALTADYAAFKNGEKNISLYTIRNKSLVHESRLVLNPNSDSDANHDYSFSHWYPVWIENGASFTTPVTRIRVGQSFFETLSAYRTDNEIDRFPSLETKLGDKFDNISKSAIYTISIGPGGSSMLPYKDVAAWAQNYFDPAIVFLGYGYQPGANFEGDPSPPYLPPDPEFGTLEELKQMISDLQKQGKLVMPFTIPSIWNNPVWINEAPSLQDIAAIDFFGDPIIADSASDGWLESYWVCPYSDFVKQKYNQIYSDNFNILGCDMIYEDVANISHGWDFNTHSPSPMNSAQGWLEHFSEFSDYLVCTEGINDALSEYVVGFLAIVWFGDYMNPSGGETQWDYTNGTGIQRHYPIGPLLFHDKIVPFSAWGFNTTSKDILSFCLLNGISLSRRMDAGLRAPSTSWLDEVRDFQQIVLSRIIGKKMTDYIEFSGTVSQSTFEDIRVVKNHHPQNEYDNGIYSISPQGALVTSNSGDLIAGIFNKYNNRQLEPGDHFIIEERFEDEIIIHYPYKNSTELAISLLPTWNEAGSIRVTAYSEDSVMMESSFATIEDSKLIFNCRHSIKGKEIKYYSIVQSGTLIQPTINIFYENGMDTIIIGNRDYYEIGIDKGGNAMSTGGISYMLDRKTNTRLTTELGHDDRLWHARTNDSPEGYYQVGSDGHFPESYNWSDTTNTLTMEYLPGPDSISYQKLRVSVSITLYEEPYFDMKMTLKNDCNFPFSEISFPAQLEFIKDDIENVLLPYGFPGIIIEKSFFSSNSPFLYSLYPQDLHADLMSVNIHNSFLTIYSLPDSPPVRPSVLLWEETEDPELLKFEHNYIVWIDKDSSWTSPTIRIYIGKTFDESLEAYRKDNNLESFPSIEDKLGSISEDILKAPLNNLSFSNDNWTWTFPDVPDGLTHLTSPSIIGLSDINIDGYYGSHPDYLPPNPRLGTTDNFIQLYNSLHDYGHYVMPTTILSWWNDNSPTIQGMSGSIANIAQKDKDGQPITQSIQEQNGYYISPYNAIVQQKISDVFNDLTNTLSSDMIFLDKVDFTDGDQNNYDFNNSSPSPINYHQGWIQNVKTHKESNLIIKKGYDRQAESSVGFLGTLLSRVEGNDFPFPYGLEDGQWKYYPSAQILFGDKVLFYQTPDQPTTSKSALIWNLSFGVMMNWTEMGGGEGNEQYLEWLPVISDFQNYVLSGYVQNRMTDCTNLSTDVTTSYFGNTQVITNWNSSVSYDYGRHTISAEGIFVEDTNADLTAGIFTRFNDENLNFGDHYLIIERQDSLIYVRQPMGSNTPIRIERPISWTNESGIHVFANLPTGYEEVSFTDDGAYIRFNLNRTLNEVNISHYKITGGHTGLSDEYDSNKAIQFQLFQNFPNPFNSETTIRFDISRSAQVGLKIYNYLGQEIRSMIDEAREAGKYTIVWDGKNNAGTVQSTGIYMVKLEVEGQVSIKRIVIMR